MHLVLVQFNIPPNVQLSGFFQLFVSNVLSVTFLPSTFEATTVPGVKMRRPPPRPPALEVVVVEEEEEEEEEEDAVSVRVLFFDLDDLDVGELKSPPPNIFFFVNLLCVDFELL